MTAPTLCGCGCERDRAEVVREVARTMRLNEDQADAIVPTAAIHSCAGCGMSAQMPCADGCVSSSCLGCEWDGDKPITRSFDCPVHGGDTGDGPEPPEEPSFEELLANPHLQFALDTELLPHLLAFGPVKGCVTCRPHLFCPVHVPSTSGRVEPASSAGGDQ